MPSTCTLCDNKIMRDDTSIIRQTRCWVESVIVGLNFCPFAGREVNEGKVYYHVSHDKDLEQVLHSLIHECQRLDQQPKIETTLLILADAFQDFNAYLELVDIANELLQQQEYQGVYQIASFHPDYCFEGEDADDAANYTNRSPFPILHIIREESLEKVLENYPNPESIPERNIELARRKGRDEMRKLLDRCLLDLER